MSYRTPGTRPVEPIEETPEPPKLPVVVVSVVRYGWLWGLLAVGLVAASVGVAFAPGTDLGKFWPLAFGAAVIAFFVVVPNRTVLRMDANTRSVTVTTRALLRAGLSYDRSLEDVSEATVESIDDSDFMALHLTENGKPVHFATGGDTSCREAAEAINAFLREMRKASKKETKAT